MSDTIINFWDYMRQFSNLELARKQVELADVIRRASVNTFVSKMRRGKFTHLEKETIYKYLVPDTKDAEYECLEFFKVQENVINQ